MFCLQGNLYKRLPMIIFLLCAQAAKADFEKTAGTVKDLLELTIVHIMDFNF